MRADDDALKSGLLPVSDVFALFQRFRRTGDSVSLLHVPPSLGNHAQSLVSRVPVPHKPAAVDRSRSSHASPAVDVHGLSFVQRIVYGVEYERHLFRVLRDRQVAYGEFAGFGQVDEVVDADIKQFFELPAASSGFLSPGYSPAANRPCCTQ